MVMQFKVQQDEEGELVLVKGEDRIDIDETIVELQRARMACPRIKDQGPLKLALALIDQLRREKRAALSEINRLRHAEHVRRSGGKLASHSQAELKR